MKIKTKSTISNDMIELFVLHCFCFSATVRLLLNLLLSRVVSVADQGEPPPHFLNQTQARRQEKKIETTPPQLSQGMDDRPASTSPSLSEGLDRQLDFVHIYFENISCQQILKEGNVQASSKGSGQHAKKLSSV